MSVVKFLPELKSSFQHALTVVSAIKLSGVSFINQTIITNKEATLIKFIIFTSLLSLGGLPPFLGFLPK
jgi:NADH:ubiquinone oxidoreductase subunit 2 (subunit N)